MEDDQTEAVDLVPQNSRSAQTLSLPSFGVGTWESPRIKFYFTSASLQLGTKTGSQPDLETMSTFLASQECISCKLCRMEMSSVLEVVLHWQWEMEKLGQRTEECKEQEDIPHAEVRPVVGEHCEEDTEMDQTDEEENVEESSEEEPPVKPEMIQSQVMESHLVGGDLCDVKSENCEMKSAILACKVCDYTCTKRGTLSVHKRN